MKILFVTDLIPIAKDENCAKALIPIIKELQKSNTVDVIRPNFLLNSLIRGKKILNDGVYNINGLEIKNFNFLFPFLFSSKNIDIRKYDKIIAHMPSGILFVERLLKQNTYNNPQITYAVHQSDIHVLTDLKYSFYFKSALKKAYENCDEIICRAPHLKKKLLNILPACEGKIKVNDISVDKWNFLSETQMLEKFSNIDTLSFISVANFIKRKNLDILIKAFSLHKDKNFVLKIVGDGKEKKKLKKLCKKLNLEKNIVFMGNLAHEAVLEEMRQSQVFILPSEKETLGLVYLEAISSGCFCVGAKNTGIDGVLLDNINCFLCEPSVKGVSLVIDKVFRLTQDDFENLLKNRNIVDLKFIS